MTNPKASYEEIAAAWEQARQSSGSRQEFQTKWTEALNRLGWTREEFHQELDRQNRTL